MDDTESPTFRTMTAENKGRCRLRSLSVVALAVISLFMLFIHETRVHTLVLQSCSRPIVLLLGAVWSLATVAFLCHTRGLDVVRVLSGGKDKGGLPSVASLEHDLVFLAVGLTFAYLMCGGFIHLLHDRSTQAVEWELFAVAAFLLLFGLMMSPARVLPLPSHRASVVRSLGRTLCAGVFPVCFADVLCGDYLTSFSKGFGDLFICSCGMYNPVIWTCITALWTPAACSIPFCLRLFQCLRCYYDQPANRHLANALKYSLGVAVVFCSTLKRRGYPGYLYFFLVGVNSLYSFYWDVVWDWGLSPKTLTFEASRHSAFPLWIYRVAVVIDLSLRISWSVKLVAPVAGEDAVWLALFLELIRRTIWACFRLDYEAHVQSKPKEVATTQKPEVPLQPIRTAVKRIGPETETKDTL